MRGGIVALYRAKPQDGAAWITGASAGMGRAVAQRLADQGYTVYASARSADDLSRMGREYSGKGRIVPLPLDVTDRAAGEKAVERIIEEAGSLVLAIFNAGNYLPNRGFDLKHETFEQTFAINFFGVLNGFIPALDAMKEAGRGHIAIVASSSGYGGLPNASAYASSKSALINMAESLKFDLDLMNVRLQVVTPGFVDTPLTQKNDFPMPFLMPVDDAAGAFLKGLGSNAFDITFPKRFTYLLKMLNLLPYRLYFPLVASFTGVGKKKR